MGADAVLLIVAALDDAELTDLHALAVELGLDALVEIHDEAELDRAMRAGAAVIGVNQRDLVTFDVDTERAVRVGAAMSADVLRVAESGIRGPDDAARLDGGGVPRGAGGGVRRDGGGPGAISHRPSSTASVASSACS